MSSRRTVLILALALLFVSQTRNVAAAIPTVQYQTGRYGRRSEVPHPSTLWRDEGVTSEYSDVTDIDTFVQRAMALPYFSGADKILHRQALERMARAYKYGTYYEDGSAFFAEYSYLRWNLNTRRGSAIFQYALTEMPMPELALQRNG